MNWYPNSIIPYPFSGIQSGFVVHPYHVSFLYDELSGVENSIGFNPLNGFTSITARITGIETGYWNISQDSVVSPLIITNNGGVSILSGQFGTALQNGFITAVDWTSFNSRVFRAGDTITGGLTVVGLLSGREVYQSGNRVIDSGVNIGAGTGIFAYRSGNELQFKSLVPGTSITLDSDGNSITINSTATGGGASVTMPASNTVSGIPMFSGITGGGFLNSSWSFGDAVTMVSPGSGTLKLGHNASIITVTSGFGNIGSTTGYIANVYTTNINGGRVILGKYNEVPAGNINGINTNYSLGFPPYNNSLQLFKSGLYMMTSGVGGAMEDYEIVSGNVIRFFVAPPSGSPLVCNYNYIG